MKGECLNFLDQFD